MGVQYTSNSCVRFVGNLFLAGSIAFLPAACANKNIPLLKDYTDLNSADVVLKVMCETKQEINQYAEIELWKKFSAVLSQKTALKKGELYFKKIEEKLDELKKAHDDLGSKIGKVNGLVSENGRLVIEQEYIRGLSGSEGNPAAKAALLKKMYDITIKIAENDILLAEEGVVVPEEIIAKSRKVTEYDKGYQNIVEFYNTEIKKLKRKQKTAKNKFKRYLESHKDIHYFLATFINFTFDFHITENNSATISLAPKKVLSHGTFSDTQKAGPGTLKRDSQRQINVTSTFEELWNTDCISDPNFQFAKSKNIYPITGNIGVRHFIDQFFAVEKLDKIRSNNETFDNTIIYTTDLKGSVNPAIKLIPIGNGTLDISAELSSGRQDIHKVKLAILVPTKLGGKKP